MKSLFITLLIGAVVATARADDRPNIILIVANEVGRDWVELLRRRASVLPMSTDSRSRVCATKQRGALPWLYANTSVSLLTGQYPFRHGWTQRLRRSASGAVRGLSWKRIHNLCTRPPRFRLRDGNRW